MAYQIQMANSAHRHFKAAEELYEITSAGTQPGCKAVAGYLYGLTGEMAVKFMMVSSGIKNDRELPKRENPYYAHFPELKHQLKNMIYGRRAGELRKIYENDRLFQYWDTAMRYAPTKDINIVWVSDWRESAKALIERMESL